MTPLHDLVIATSLVPGALVRLGIFSSLPVTAQRKTGSHRNRGDEVELELCLYLLDQHVEFVHGKPSDPFEVALSIFILHRSRPGTLKPEHENGGSEEAPVIECIRICGD